MIVRKEKMSTKIKNYFKNIFSKMLNSAKKNKKKKGSNIRKEYVAQATNEEVKSRNIAIENKRNDYVGEKVHQNKNKEITVEFVGNKRKPKEITIEYENKTPKKKKEIVVEYENRKRANSISKENSNIQTKKNPTTPKQPINNKQANRNTNNQKKDFSDKAKNNQVKPKNYIDNVKKDKIQYTSNIKKHNKEAKILEKKDVIEVRKPIIENIESKPEIKEKKVVTELALKPTKIKKEKKIFNIFQLFKEKERKKRKEILNRVRENKMDDYETISTKTKLSRGSIAVEDVDANELDPLIDLYRDSNKKLRNRIRESQNF